MIWMPHWSKRICEMEGVWRTSEDLLHPFFTLIKSSIFLLAMYLHGKSCVAEALSHLLPDCVEALEAVGANGGRSQQGVWRPGRAWSREWVHGPRARAPAASAHHVEAHGCRRRKGWLGCRLSLCRGGQQHGRVGWRHRDDQWRQGFVVGGGGAWPLRISAACGHGCRLIVDGHAPGIGLWGRVLGGGEGWGVRHWCRDA